MDGCHSRQSPPPPTALNLAQFPPLTTSLTTSPSQPNPNHSSDTPVATHPSTHLPDNEHATPSTSQSNPNDLKFEFVDILYCQARLDQQHQLAQLMESHRQLHIQTTLRQLADHFSIAGLLPTPISNAINPTLATHLLTQPTPINPTATPPSYVISPLATVPHLPSSDPVSFPPSLLPRPRLHISPPPIHHSHYPFPYRFRRFFRHPIPLQLFPLTPTTTTPNHLINPSWVFAIFLTVTLLASSLRWNTNFTTTKPHCPITSSSLSSTSIAQHRVGIMA